MKRLTLSLLVILAFPLIYSCGSKSSSTPTNNGNNNTTVVDTNSFITVTGSYTDNNNTFLNNNNINAKIDFRHDAVLIGDSLIYTAADSVNHITESYYIQVLVNQSYTLKFNLKLYDKSNTISNRIDLYPAIGDNDLLGSDINDILPKGNIVVLESITQGKRIKGTFIAKWDKFYSNTASLTGSFDLDFSKAK